ncbi:Fanconi anemia group J protein homolog isoform X2 [Macadamia integrifolia]|uniref:Fanconi anemia group J protein homolog isoform X2 n=1 Tax=Macadamia integrifolia TaxID=60698 RepID=UPI001C4F573E|nr:Fanconi anemia group J protein homolog isoform X2 [Macadamia integrifolia]
MDSTATKPNKPSGVYHIGGIPVEFPYKPYGTQLAFMGRVISTLDRAQSQGHCHALLESPTGTGKSLSLLCSTLAWQQNQNTKNLSESKPAPEALSDPIAHGGGFIPEPEPSGNSIPGALQPSPSAMNSMSPKKKTPTIFYASRTHSQISQLIREYRKTSYRVKMAVLASKKHYCTNKHICGQENIDEKCKKLLKDPAGVGCFEFKNAHKVKAHPSLHSGGCHEAHDIEDLVKVGRAVNGCSYYAARSMAEVAKLVFCPYSYVINPIIRRAMEVDLKGSILILDEAHNIEDMAREAGSVDVEEDMLDVLQTELGQLCFADSTTYQPLHETIEGIISWIGQRKSTLQKHEFQHYCTCWTGEKALRELQEAGISKHCFPILKECAAKAIKAASNVESKEVSLTGMSAAVLEGLFSSFSYFFSGNGLHILDYQLVLQRYASRDGEHGGNWKHSFSLWCLNPAVVFREIAGLSMSVILTSGTLSPMDSFAAELGVQFETCIEAPHVIDVGTQLWAGAISTGPGNYPLNASYKTANCYAFQDALGATLEEICKIVPDGALVFFPSYHLMEKLCNRWRETGQWSRLNAQKPVFVEPRSQEDFALALKGYHGSILRGNGPAPRKRRGKKRDLNQLDAKSTQNSSKGGAALLAVCRGKVAEGIDFSDENARVVIIVGIPFPNVHDIKVAQKKKYNDTYHSSKNLLSGNKWYCYQAFRAMNQAAGRCIRHMFDYGAILFIDERFREERNISHISKWIRKSIKQYDNFDMSIEGLQSFFRDAKERFGPKDMNVLGTPKVKEEHMPCTKQKSLSKGAVHTHDHHDGQKVIYSSITTEKENQFSQSVMSMSKDNLTLPQVKAQCGVEDEEFVPLVEKDLGSDKESIVFDCSSEKNLRWSETIPTASFNESREKILVNETSGVGENGTVGSPQDFPKAENSSITVFQASNELSDQLSFHSTSLASPSGAASRSKCFLMDTPERNANMDICDRKSENESLNLSVNSHTQKWRRHISSPLVNLIQEKQFDIPNAKFPNHVDCSGSVGSSRDAIRKIEFDFEVKDPKCKHQKLNLPQKFPVNNSVTLHASSSPVMDEQLYICCSICQNPLGLSENHFLVTCSFVSSSKVYLASLLGSRGASPARNRSITVRVLISDISSVDQRLYNRLALEGAQKHGVWCEEDGCVFGTVFCPFCSSPDSCLGLQIMATDSSNIHLLNKILFYPNRLEIKNPEESKDEVLPSIEQFSYLPQQNSEGWRTTKAKLRLPKRGLPWSEDHFGA